MGTQFDAWCPELGQKPEDAKTIKAFDAELAASAWADWHDAYTAEFSIVGGTEICVSVREHGKETIQEFTVYGEMERVYRCRRVKNTGGGI